MLQNTPEPADAKCLNLVVEAWCIAGNMKNAKRALHSIFSDLGCEPDEEVQFMCDETSRECARRPEQTRHRETQLDYKAECGVKDTDRDCYPKIDIALKHSLTRERIQTFALLAAGWARAGKISVASEILLSLATKDFDSSKIDLNAIVFDWAKKKWRRVTARARARTHTHTRCTNTHKMHTHTHTACARTHTQERERCLYLDKLRGVPICLRCRRWPSDVTAARTHTHIIQWPCYCRACLRCYELARMRSTLTQDRNLCMQVKGFDFTLPTLVKEQPPPSLEVVLSCAVPACMSLCLSSYLL